jgi:ABC-2 type transport system ATP-binding protein
MPLLTATGLSHSYGKFQALSLLDLSLEPGEITILEGPNGSGKSTLLQCLSGMLSPTTGEIRVNGYDLQTNEPEAKRALAFAPDVPRFYTELTAWEHLRFLALIHGAGQGFEARAEALLHEFGLWEARDVLPHHFSRGMSLKLGLLCALIRPFRVLLLDEPTSALDLESSQLLNRRLKEVRLGGAAIMLSTHDPDLKAGLADRVLLMREGHLHAA